jgi:hypothetical protein
LEQSHLIHSAAARLHVRRALARMSYEDWMAWLRTFDRRMSFNMQHVRAALPALDRASHQRHIDRALQEGRVRRARYSNGVHRYQIVRDVGTGGGDGR